MRCAQGHVIAPYESGRRSAGAQHGRPAVEGETVGGENKRWVTACVLIRAAAECRKRGPIANTSGEGSKQMACLSVRGPRGFSGSSARCQPMQARRFLTKPVV